MFIHTYLNFGKQKNHRNEKLVFFCLTEIATTYVSNQCTCYHINTASGKTSYIDHRYFNLKV